MVQLPGQIEKLADLPYYTEGPAADGEGNIYFSTLSGGSIFRIGKGEREAKEWARSACPNGQLILPGGDHLVCDSALGCIRRFASDGRLLRDELNGICAGERILVPNDLIADRAGRIYFTDSVRHEGKVCFMEEGGEQGILAGGLDYPNGLVLSGDHHWLYVAESYRNRILKIPLRERGDPGILSDLPANKSGRAEDNLPDGLALDSRGNVWVAHYGMQALQVLSPEGEWLFSVDTCLPLTSNLFFLDPATVVVTGGYGEPGPGAVLKINL